MMTLAEIVEKRKRSWEKRNDIVYDGQLVTSAVRYVLDNDNLREEIKSAPWKLIEIAFTVVDKKQKTVPFFFNEVQRDFIQHLEHRTPGIPIYVLKGRQQGFTTLITAIQLAYAITRRNFAGFTVANAQINTDSIFNDKARAVYDRLPGILKPTEKFNNRKELYFDKLNSSWRVATASKELGRSKTLEFCHFSEVAFYECLMSDLQKSIGEALTANAIVIYETTANGYNEAKDLWDSESCDNLFYEWWRSEEYVSDDVAVIEQAKDEWLINRIKWLRGNGISDRQIAWYVKKYNLYIDKNSIKQEYPCFPEEAFIASGECEFGNELVIRRINECRALQPKKRGYFTYNIEPTDNDTIAYKDIRWVDDASGDISIYEEPYSDEKRGKKPYAIGGDTAGDGSDYFTAHVIDNITGKQVAVYRRQKIDDDLYADQIYCLGQYYNGAIIGIEVNFEYEPTRRLQRAQYPRLYMRERIDSLKNPIELKYGFKTTAFTRPTIIADFKRKWRESDGDIVCDIQTLYEMLTFVRNDKGKAEAIIGKHDDLIMALMITHFVSEQGDHTYKDIPEPDIDEDDDDYDNVYVNGNEYMEWI